jgi:hypothetical protein
MGKNMRAFTAALIAFGLPAAAHAQECAAYVGQKISPQTFDSIAASLAKVPGKKGEFETTAEFEAKVQAATAGLKSPLVVTVPVDSKYVKYDADTGTFSIISYALKNSNAFLDKFFSKQGMPGFAHFMYNHHVVVSSTDKVTGTYSASNSFGASADIAEIARTTKVIFDRNANGHEDQFFPDIPDRPKEDPILFTIKADTKAAPAMKAGFKGAVVIAPKAPFFVKGSAGANTPTISNPREITETMQVVVADIQCALLTDAAGIVLGAARTG